MINVSEILTTAPSSCRTELQSRVYETLEALGIPYERVETSEIITMEDCAAVNAVLDMHMVKTLFLCNRQQTEHYLFITAGDVPFRAKDFSAALGISRVSFAQSEKMEQMLGTKIGAATVFSALLESARDVHIVFDRAVADDSSYGCSDGTTTGYMKLKTDDVLHRFLPFTGHTFTVIDGGKDT